jgi:hypothetical protein
MEPFVAYERLRDGKSTGDCCQQVRGRVQEMVERGEARLLKTKKSKSEPVKPVREYKSDTQEVKTDG